MARPPTIKDEEILAAAREVFLEQGIRATTAQVARRAGIAEGSVFNRFKSKWELFEAAMRPDIDEPPFFATLAERVGKGEVRQNLIDVGINALEFLTHVFPLVLMSWSNPGPRGLPALLDTPEPLPLRVLVRVTAYLEAEMRKKRLRRRDPQVAARLFIGSLANYVLFQLLLRVRVELAPAAYVEELVGILLDGLGPQKGA